VLREIASTAAVVAPESRTDFFRASGVFFITDQMVYENIAAMMEAYAEQAVEAARKMNITLDYKEESIEWLEKILSQLHADRPVFLGKVAPGEDDPAQKQIDAMSRIWGGYFGEVIRRCWGGEWDARNLSRHSRSYGYPRDRRIEDISRDESIPPAHQRRRR
jgi:hypothetical protein